MLLPSWWKRYRDTDIVGLNYKKEGVVLFNNQIISGDYSKTPFLMRSSALFIEIMSRNSILSDRIRAN